MPGTVFVTCWLSTVMWNSPAVREARLDMHVRKWTEAAKQIKDFRCEFKRKRIDTTFHTEAVDYVSVSGTGSRLLRSDVRNANQELDWTFYIQDNEVHLYDHRQRTELAGKWPPEKRADGERGGFFYRALFSEFPGHVIDLSLVLAGIPPTDVKRRFKVTLEAEDTSYVYLRSLPHSVDERAAYTDAWLALDKKDYRTRLLSITTPSHDVIRYELKRREMNVSPPISAEVLGRDLQERWRPFGAPADH